MQKQSDLAIANIVVLSDGSLDGRTNPVQLPATLGHLYRELGPLAFKKVFVEGEFRYDYDLINGRFYENYSQPAPLYNDLNGKQVSGKGAMKCLSRLDRNPKKSGRHLHYRYGRRRNGKKRAIPRVLGILREAAFSECSEGCELPIPGLRRKHVKKIEGLWEMGFYGRPRHLLQDTWKVYRRTQYKCSANEKFL